MLTNQPLPRLKNMQKYSCLILIFTLLSCNKEEIEQDHRNPYRGDFTFSVIHSYSDLSSGSQTDTFIYDGVVLTFQEAEEQLNPDGIQVESSTRRLFVQFSDFNYATPVLLDDGRFEEYAQPGSGGGYFKGGFEGYNNLSFESFQQLGLGGSSTYVVSGVRK